MFSQLTDLDLRLIRVFLAIVDAGGVSPAQATLNVGQSTISTQLATLETRLGYRLCERGRGGFSLTARGEQFIDAARALLSAVDTFGMQARNVGRKLVGTLDIGMIGHTPVSASARISDAIGRFRARDQSVRFSILVRSPGELEELLLNGRIQIGIGYFWHRVPSLEYTEVFAEDQFAYCAKGHPLFASSRRSAARRSRGSRMGVAQLSAPRSRKFDDAAKRHRRRGQHGSGRDAGAVGASSRLSAGAFRGAVREAGLVGRIESGTDAVPRGVPYGHAGAAASNGYR